MEDAANTVAEVGQAIEPYARLLQNLASIAQAVTGKRASDGSENSYDIQRNELLEIVSSAQLAAIEAQTVQAKQSARIRELEEKIKQYDDWEHEKHRYFLKQVEQAGFVYCLKDKYISEDEPRHFICPNCAGNAKKTLLQQEQYISRGFQQLKCPHCDTIIAFSKQFMDTSSKG